MMLSLSAGCLMAAGCKPRPAQPQAAAPPQEEEIIVEPAAPVPTEEEAPLNAETPELKVKTSAQVSILCYHDFITGKSNNAMVINIDHFRQHLQALRDAKLPVISMADYLAWRDGEKDIPDPSVLITIDDGWRSVYTLAHPVLKEFGYPYTIFLYKNYVNKGGRTMKTEEIRQLMAEGATVGSHSVSHPYPPEYRRRAKGPAEEYQAWLAHEFVESKAYLENLLGIKVITYAYPGGYFTPEMAQKGTGEWGYKALFTCNPVRTSWDTPLAEIGRFIIFGNDPADRNFKLATNFAGGSVDLGRQLLGGQMGEDGQPQESLVRVIPAENETVTSRRPRITVDLSKLEGIDPASVVMRLPGFGEVPATYNADTRQLVYQPAATLRTPEVPVHVRLRRQGEAKDDVISWKFFIDLNAHYLPKPQPAPSADFPEASETPPTEN